MAGTPNLHVETNLLHEKHAQILIVPLEEFFQSGYLVACLLSTYCSRVCVCVCGSADKNSGDNSWLLCGISTVCNKDRQPSVAVIAVK